MFAVGMYHLMLWKSWSILLHFSMNDADLISPIPAKDKTH